MPRAAKYDRQEALNKAVTLFWRQGYHASSLKDLEHWLDMRPGSLYAAFGSKQALFIEALDSYTEQMSAQLQSSLALENSYLAALKTFLAELVLGDSENNEAPARACMIVKTLLEITPEDTLLHAKVNDLLVQMERNFEQLLLQAKNRGELRNNVDCMRLARLVQVQVMGLRSYAQRDLERSELEPVLEDIFSMLESFAARQ